jgi:hypothetical protein
LVFAKKNKPEKILIIANKLDTSVEMANKVRAFTEQWPSWVGISFSNEKNSQRHFNLIMDCEVKAVATSKDALRGYTPTILYLMRRRLLRQTQIFGQHVWLRYLRGVKLLLYPHQTDMTQFIMKFTTKSLRRMNDFKISEMFWYRDPRYTKDLYMVKTPDLVHFLLNREEYS